MKRQGKIHIDCPFTQAEIDEFHSMLYNTAARNNMTAHKTWIEGFNRSECRKVERHTEAYKEWLQQQLQEIQQ